MQLNSDISAVITGGASGLGAATARRLASHGVKVAIFDMNEAIGQALASELDGVYCNVDVTSEEQVDAAFAKADRVVRTSIWVSPRALAKDSMRGLKALSSRMIASCSASGTALRALFLVTSSGKARG